MYLDEGFTNHMWERGDVESQVPLTSSSSMAV